MGFFQGGVVISRVNSPLSLSCSFSCSSDYSWIFFSIFVFLFFFFLFTISYYFHLFPTLLSLHPEFYGISGVFGGYRDASLFFGPGPSPGIGIRVGSVRDTVNLSKEGQPTPFLQKNDAKMRQDVYDGNSKSSRYTMKTCNWNNTSSQLKILITTNPIQIFHQIFYLPQPQQKSNKIPV